MAYRVTFSRAAWSDLNEIVRYISIDDPIQAFRFAMFLLRHALSLGQFPERGRVVPESTSRTYREILVRAYRIVYRVYHSDQTVEIIRFWHTGRASPLLPE